jgi:uncharacterized phage-associated protein
MLPQFEFDEKAALEAVLYICSKTTRPTYHSIAKLLYFADCLHLERYGRFICGDSYVAMAWGPVPSAVYDMMKERHPDYRGNVRFPSTKGSIEVHGKHSVRALREPDLDWLSDSDIKCLDEAIKRYGHYDFGKRTKESHALPWEKTWKERPNGIIDLGLFVQSVGEPEGLREYLQDPYP